MITKELLNNYSHLEQAIKMNKYKIEQLEKKPPTVEYDRVYGSSVNFPYTVRSYKVEGYCGSRADRWNERILALKCKLEKQLIELENTKLEIEEFIANLPSENALDQLIFTYIYLKGMSQIEVAMKLHMDQSNVSRRISECLKRYSKIA